jgi:predicted dehydrogenase
MSALRWGILAPGGIAHQMVSDLQLVGLDVAAVGSRDLGRATDFAARYGIPRAYGGYAELVADPDIDIVYIASTQNAHTEHALLALDAGKHVLMEKPFTLSGTDAQTVVDLAADRGLVVLEAMWTRYLPHMVRLREILAAGTIGEIRTVIADHAQQLRFPPSRLMDIEKGGGALLDLGIYPVAFAWDVLGAPSTILAHGTLTETGVDEQTSIIFGYDSGAHAVITTGLASPGQTRAAIHGHDGRIEFDHTFYDATGFTVYDRQGEVVERVVCDIEGRGMQFQAIEMERLVATGTLSGPIQPPQQTADILIALDEVRRQIGLVYPGE